jgi:hypothetical protein
LKDGNFPSFITNHLTTHKSEIISDTKLEKERLVVAALELETWLSPSLPLLSRSRLQPVVIDAYGRPRNCSKRP